GRKEACAWHPLDREGVLQCRRAADDLGLSHAEEFCAEGRRAVDHAREGCRRRDPWQNERARRARRLAKLQRYLRHHQQPLRSRTHTRWFLGRIIGGTCGGGWNPLPRPRYLRASAAARL